MPPLERKMGGSRYLILVCSSLLHKANVREPMVVWIQIMGHRPTFALCKSAQPSSEN